MQIISSQRKILFFLALFMLGSMAVIALATKETLERSQNKALERFGRDQSDLARAAAASLEDALLLRIRLLGEVIRQLPSDLPAEKLPAFLQGIFDRGEGFFSVVYLLNNDGGVRYAYPAGAPVKAPDVFARTKARGVDLGIEITETGDLLVSARLVKDTNSILIAVLNKENLRENCLEKLSSRLARDLFILSADGRIVVRQSHRQASPDTTHKHEEVISLAGIHDEGGMVRIKQEDDSDFVAYAPAHLPGSRLFLGLRTPPAMVKGYLVEGSRFIIAMAGSRLIALTGCMFLFYFFNKQRLQAKQETLQLREEQKLLSRLEESEERYKTLVENLLSPVVIFQDDRIRFTNRMFTKLTHYSSEEVTAEGFDLLCLVHEDDRALVQENVARLLDEERLELPQEIRYVKKNGEIVVGLTLSSLVHFEGRRAVETVVIDITRMKRIEQELFEMRKRLQYLLDNAPIMIFSLDHEGKFSYANKETLRITGYKLDDWLNRSFAPIIHPDDLALAVAKFEEGRRGIPRRDYKLRIVNAAGNLRVLHIVADAIWEDNQFKGSLIIASDITEQQRLQQAIKETRDHLANIIENAGDAIITVDIIGNIVSWNKTAEQMFHFVEPFAFHKPLSSLLNTNSARMTKLIDRVTQGETIRDEEIECVCERTRVDTLFTFSPIRDAPGKVIGISCFAKDITERRNLENQLERDKEFIHQLIENANALIAAADEKGKIVIFNRLFEEVSGYTKEEALGQDPLELLIPKEYRESVAQKVGKIRGNKPLLEIEIPILSKDGRMLTVTWNAAAVNLPSGHAAVVVVGQDVSEQKKMQEELIQSKKLISIGELVSGVAHELNNPLTIIMGYSQLLISERELLEKHRVMANKVLDAATRSKRIVENLLAFARKKKLQKEQININEILESTLLLREHNLAVNNITLVRSYEENLPQVFADAHQLQQVFLNLINNAFDAMFEAHRGGTLEVKTFRKNETLFIEMTDTGPGVPESIQEKIFDPFFTTKEVGKGTGLGMSLSYGIIKEHGGRIYLDKTHQPGARFIIELPFTQHAQVLEAQASYM